MLERRGRRSNRYHVSILVFVELALDAPSVRDREGCSGVSILVFVELALDVLQCIDVLRVEIYVSILVFVELALDAR